MVLEIIVVFACLPELPKIDFLANMAPKLEPKWDQNRTERGLGSEFGSRTDFGSIFGRFGSIFGPTFDKFWDDCWLNFDGCLCIVCLIFNRLRSPALHRAAASAVRPLK